MKYLLVFVVACGSTQRVLPDDKRCTEDILKSFAAKLTVDVPTFDVEQPAGSTSDAGRRFAEFRVTGKAEDKIKEVADRSNMEIDVSALDPGLLVRATCR